MRGLSRLILTTIFVLIALAPRRAAAWYFPEHVLLSSDGHEALPRELRPIIEATIAAARAQGLKICERSDVTLDEALVRKPIRTTMIKADSSVECIPYAALAGLAGDHASSVDELRSSLAGEGAIEIVSAVAFEWKRFREAFKRDPAAIDRMAYVHELDVALYFVDTEYVTRARATRSHFHDAGRTLPEILRDLGATGRIDDVLSRFVFHHLRSLAIAAHAKVPADRVEALLEHAFAVHFLEDAFSSGHLVMTEEHWAAGRQKVRHRHDAYDATGLALTRAMGKNACLVTGPASLETAGLPPCWTTTGDGYLGPFADSSDRRHVAAAIARAEVAFALALDPARVVSYASELGERQRLVFAATLDPVPWWTVEGEARKNLPASAARALRFVKGAAAAVAKLKEAPISVALPVDVATRPNAVDAAYLANIVDPCVAREKIDAALRADSDAPGSAAGGPSSRSDQETKGNDDDAGGACGEGKSVAVGTVGVSLLRPTLAHWPTARDDITHTTVEGHRDEGWAIQVFAASGTTVIIPPSKPVDFLGPGLSLTAGISYRFGSLLPGRSGRPAFEVNVGISEQMHLNTAGRAGGFPHVTMFHQELRWPILWEAMTTYTLPLNLAAVHRAGYLLFFNGVRVHELLNQGRPVFLGVEIEAASFALSRGYGTHPLYAISPELRFYVGLTDPSAAQPSYPGTVGVSFGIAITGGYATFL